MRDLTRREVVQGTLAATALAGSGVISPSSIAAVRSDASLRLACCYYPEHWPRARWKQDAADMVARGLSRVRIGEFAWTLMEPEAGRYDWGWLDDAVDTLGGAGLGVVLGTPTASPPEWLVARHPDILPVGKDGRIKEFGSRRYYTFASATYREECRRIAAAMADRYGRHRSVVGWQIDNEYGCHDTTYSYSQVDLAAFRGWLRNRYGTIKRLNEAWGTVVWSQQLSAFEDVGLPVSTPTDYPPAMMLDYRRWASDQVAEFQKVQLDAIRPRSPGRFITTNFMGNFTEFDQYPVAQDLDFASWDSYPLGVAAGREDSQWDRTGNPDITGWNHDLVRGLNPAPFWIMEQQPGAVNWARYNPVPLPGMVRLWTWEAFAHGAGTVSYFRWRQGLTGPEQMHAGLNQSDGSISPGGMEAVRVAKEVAQIGTVPASTRGDVALLFDYESVWATEIQPNGAGQNNLAQAQSWYAALRRLGLDVDVVRAGAAVADYKLVVVPSVLMIDQQAVQALRHVDGLVVIGPRSGSKTADFARSADLPPGPLQALVQVKVRQVGVLRPDTGERVSGSGISGKVVAWREWLDTGLPVRARHADGEAAVVGNDRAWYVGCQGDRTFTDTLIEAAARQAGLVVQALPDGVRLRRRGNLRFAFNYRDSTWELPASAGGQFLVGSRSIPPQGISVWRQSRT